MANQILSPKAEPVETEEEKVNEQYRKLDTFIEEDIGDRKAAREKIFREIVENAYSKMDSRDASDSMNVIEELKKFDKVPDEASDELLGKLIKVLIKFVPAVVKDDKAKQKQYAAVNTFFRFVKHRRMLDRLRSARKDLGRLQLKKLVQSEDEASRTLGVDLVLFLVRNIEAIVPLTLVDNDETAWSIVQRHSDLTAWNTIRDHQKKLKAFATRMAALEAAVAGSGKKVLDASGALNGGAGNMHEGDDPTFETLHDVIEDDAPEKEPPNET